MLQDCKPDALHSVGSTDSTIASVSAALSDWWFLLDYKIRILRASVPILHLPALLSKIPGNYVNAAVWTCAEPAMGIVSACLPSVHPLLKMAIGATARRRSRLASKRARKGRGQQGFHQLQDVQEFGDRYGHSVHISSSNSVGESEQAASSGQIELQTSQIRVKTEVTLTSTNNIDYKEELF